MSIISQTDENTITLSDTLYSQTVNAGIVISDANLARTEIILDVRASQAIGQTRNYCITPRVWNDGAITKITVERGNNGGTLVCHYVLKVYTVASGVLVDRGETTLDTVTKDVTIPTRQANRRYVRHYVRSTVDNALQTQMVTGKVLDDSTLRFQGNVAASDITIRYQVVYYPTNHVTTLELSATGSSYNYDITSLGYKKNNTFIIMSQRYGGTSGIDNDEFKGVEMNTDTNINIYSFFADTHNVVVQLIYNPRTKVQRKVNTISTVPFNVVFDDAFVIAESFHNFPAHMQYFIPSDYNGTTPNNSQDFAFTSLFNSNTTITVQKFVGGIQSKIVSEVVELDKFIVVTNPPKWHHYNMLNKRRRFR